MSAARPQGDRPARSSGTRAARPSATPPPSTTARVRAAVRSVRAATWRPLVVGALIGGMAWALGMEGPSAVVVALAAGTLTAVLVRVDAAGEPRPARHVPESRDGSRGEVQDLAWSMAGRDGRAGERALRHLRRAAARRLARHGLDLEDPEDAAAVADLVGARAHATLTRRQHPLPSVPDLVHTVDVLERLGATRTRPATPAPDPDPRSPR